MTRAALMSLTAIAALAGCSTGDTPGAPGTPSTSPTRTAAMTAPSVPTPSATATPPEPRVSRDIADLRRQLFRADTGRFASELSVPGARIMRRGVFSISDVATDITVFTAVRGRGTLSARVIAIGSDNFVRLPASEPGGFNKCWVTYPAERFEELLGDVVGVDPGGLTGGIPPEVGVVLFGAAGRAGPTSDLVGVATLVNTKLVAGLGRTLDDEIRTPVTFLAADGEVAGWQTDASTIIDSAVSSGSDVAPELEVCEAR